MIKNSILILSITIGSAFCYRNDIIRQCKQTDDACIANSAKHALLKILSGIPESNVEPSDPLHIGEVQGDLSMLKYTFSETVASGFSNCDIYNIKLDLNKPLMRFNLTCPNIRVDGKYKINGQLIILPVEGEGPVYILIKKYEIGVIAEPKIVVGKDGKNHMMVKKYQVHGETKDGVVYDLQNLFGGRKDLGDIVLKFANSNWKKVADFVQGPILNEIFKKIVGNVNKFFKTVPVEDLYLV